MNTTTLDRIIHTAESVTPHHSPDALARAIWTVIAEPGDPATHHLITALGPEGALRYALDSGKPTFEGTDVQSMHNRALPRATTENITHAFTAARAVNAELITPEHPHWPAGLGDLGAYAPYALWARGNTDQLATTAIAIVGARAATGYGEHVAMDITTGLIERGRTIIAGAAYGIEAMAHRAALASGGTTVAYLAGGVDRYYPAGHDALLARIVEAGVVATEISCGQAPTKSRFLMRNRLIAAASTATVVIEAGWRSGALNTAAQAITLGRPLGAVPGPITSAASAGCHRLLREFGATAITNADDAADL